MNTHPYIFAGLENTNKQVETVGKKGDIRLTNQYDDLCANPHGLEIN